MLRNVARKSASLLPACNRYIQRSKPALHLVASRGIFQESSATDQGNNHHLGVPPVISATTSRPFSGTAKVSAASHDESALPQEIENVVADIEKSVEEGDVVRAQQMLDRVEGQRNLDQSNLQRVRLLVLDAWLTYQDSFIATTLDSGHQPDRVKAKEICLAAVYAQQLLERSHAVLMLDAPLLDGTTTTNNETDVQTNNPAAFKIENLHQCNSVLKALANAIRVTSEMEDKMISRGLAQRAQFLLYEMEKSHRNFGGLAPNIDSYNSVLEAWAYSKEHLRASIAERLFQRLLWFKHLHPNGESFKLIIQAWCWSKQKKSAFTATGHLMKMLRRLEAGQLDMEPTLEHYNMILEAWTNAEDKIAPTKAQTVLQLMENTYQNKLTTIRPDINSYRHYLVTSARRRWEIPDLGNYADKILATMKDSHMPVDDICYSACIRTWVNLAINPVFASSREASIERSLELLEEMTLAQHRSFVVFVHPSTTNYNDVLEALSKSTREVSAEKASELLTTMEDSIAKYDSHGDGGDDDDENLVDIRPNADSYRWMLEVLAQCSAMRNKMDRAKDILGRFQRSYDYQIGGAGTTTTITTTTEEAETVVAVLNAFLKVCETIQVANDDEGLQIIRAALSAVETMRSYSRAAQPSSNSTTTYRALLSICNTVLSPGKERLRITKIIFQACCEAGLVDDVFLRKLKAVSPPDFYTELVVQDSKDMEGTKMVPESWTRNIGMNRRLTAEGQRSIPLSIHGRFTITKAMKEFKMRRLRQKQNQKFLQGGRLQAHELQKQYS